MRGVVTRFLNLEVLSIHPFAYWALALVWLILLVAFVSSIRSQEIPATAKAIWIFLVLFVPIFGLAAYCIWCLIRADWSFLKPLFQTRSQSVKAIVGSDSKK